MQDTQIQKNNKLELLIENIRKVIVGKQETIELLCIALACEGHVLIEDVPGTGKTTLALALAKSMGGSLRRVSCTPDVMPSDITGFSMFNPKTHEFEYKEGAIMANVFLADEINRTPPKTQAGLLEAMEEHQVTVDGYVHLLPKPFMVMATQNPIEYLGTYPLPEAQLDRFLVKISLGYPNQDEELSILERFSHHNPLESLEAVLTGDEIRDLQKEVQSIEINEFASRYIIELVKATRHASQLALGLSPRATLSIARVAKAYAYYQKRDYVIPDDIKHVFIPVCSHRIVLKAEAKYENISQRSVLNEILNTVRVMG